MCQPSAHKHFARQMRLDIVKLVIAYCTRIPIIQFIENCCPACLSVSLLDHVLPGTELYLLND